MPNPSPCLRWQRLKLRLKVPFKISYGTSATRTAFWLRLSDDSGWGEGTIPPYYGVADSDMTAIWDTAAGCCDPFPDKPEEIAAWVGSKGPAPARCALDLALHDRLARRRGIPLYKLLGLPRPDAGQTAFTLSIGEPEAVAKEATAAAQYPILKLKLGGDSDIESVAAVRQARPDARLLADANGAWTVNEAVTKCRAMGRHGLEMIEQPVPAQALEGLGQVQQQIDIPVVADESLRSMEDLDRLVELGVRGVNLKLMRIGGLAATMEMLARAKKAGMKIMLGSMVETSLGVTAMAHLSGVADWLDLDAPLLVANDPFQGLRYQDAVIVLPDRPGIGVIQRP